MDIKNMVNKFANLPITTTFKTRDINTIKNIKEFQNELYDIRETLEIIKHNKKILNNKDHDSVSVDIANELIKYSTAVLSHFNNMHFTSDRPEEKIHTEVDSLNIKASLITIRNLYMDIIS